MILSNKTYAPKPVRRWSNLPKAIEKNIIQMKPVPLSTKGSKMVQWNNDTLLDYPSPQKIIPPFIQCKLKFSQFEAELDQDCSESFAKEEILSILGRQDSSSSTCIRSSFFSNSEKFNEDWSEVVKDESSDNENIEKYFYVRENRSIPERVSNPFHQNFAENENEELAELNIVKSKRSSLIKITNDEI